MTGKNHLGKTVLLIIASALVLSLKSQTKPDVAPREARIEYNSNTYDTYRANFLTDKINFYWKNNSGVKFKTLDNLKTEIEKDNTTLLFATNAGMYLSDNSPQGLYVENGKEFVPLDTLKAGYGNFYLQPNGVFLITATGAKIIQSSDFKKYKTEALYATQSGPLLVINGIINSNFTKGSTNKNIRSGVGINDKGEIIFAISENEVNFYDFAIFFKDELKCGNALYLDGAISKMYLPELKRYDSDGNFGAMIGITAK